MKIKLTFLFVMFCTAGFSQMEFAPVGAEWYYTNPKYSYSPPSTAYLECIHYKTVKDTIINQKSCKKIIVSYCSNEIKIGDLFLHQSNDSIFYFNNGNFYLLFNFSAKPGDTIVVHNEKFKPIDAFLNNDSIDFFKYTISQVDSIEINGDWYKRQHVSSSRFAEWFFWGTPAYIIEKLGSTNYFFGRLVYRYGEQALGMLRCYHDAQIDYKDDNWEMECDFLTANKQLILKNDEITLYPNPANDILNIKSTKILSNVSITDITGKTLINCTLDSNTYSIKIENLTSGIYFVKLSSKYSFTTLKFVKN